MNLKLSLVLAVKLEHQAVMAMLVEFAQRFVRTDSLMQLFIL